LILPNLTIHNFRLVKAIDLKFGQQEALALLTSWRKFQLHISFDSKVMVFKVIKLDMCGDPFSQIWSHLY